MNEKEWIKYLKKYLYEKKPVFKSTNEDCGVIKISKTKYLLLTTDALVENIHFKFDYTSYFDLGAKLAASNLSDIAAMGGEPKWALLTLGSPSPINPYWIDPLMEGLVSTLKKYGAYLIGGDTVKSSTFFINLTLIGETKNPILRKGAIPGDLIFVSKPLGESAAFLRLIKTFNLKEIPQNIKKAHLTPEPEIILGKELSKKKLATSMIDISDGLLLDLWRICEENEVGAELYQEKIPIGKGATFEEALSGGEDYALLFTVSSQNLYEIPKLTKKLKKEIFNIGKIITEKKLFLIDKNQKKEIKPLGFDHFKKGA
ncbi:thiamine-phosphate kinase [Thermodesulfobacterium hydrogeniphilum]|uniref:thiamine-phosphate kinase n=1 Tax=Thermodesulfobacterium hydrogeniphilum TaxID=161156 RepID=UPI0006904FFD|nr:thiamine-phosphate kinase [Thermodesulfobacterium hydrogeniphilum]